MAIVARLLLAGGLTFAAIAQAADHTPAHVVALTMYVTLDHVAAGPHGPRHGKIGAVDRIRLTYDADAVDPTTKRVKLLNFQHLTSGGYTPPSPDPVAMPVDDSWLDLGHAPYRLHLHAAVVHGEPIVIEVNEDTRRLTIRPQGNPMQILLSGRYRIVPADRCRHHCQSSQRLFQPSGP